MRKILTLSFIAALLMVGASSALAQTSASSTNPGPKLTFPIAELGGCDSKDACRLYCEADANKDACLTYAQKVGLMSKEKLAAAKKIIKKEGPGGCNSKEACKAYCEDSSNQDECLSFAEENKVISEEKVAFIKRIVKGEAPGACKSAETCKMYCEDSSHRDECRTFAEENGLVRKTGSSTMERVKEVLASTTPGRERGMELRAIKQGTSTPPGQIGKEPQKKLSSTTPPNMKERMGSSTEMKKPLPPAGGINTKPPEKPKAANDDLGAAVLRGFVHLLGF
ncbi:MAG: hypothetical protein V4436_01080 [Patescibacteria group bacterium]